MKGFIDLVFRYGHAFYLVDWKSNYLGNKVEDYHRGALEQVMEGHYYILQYHLYAVALHQYLSTRLPGYRYERDFGGVYYLFLRGIDPEMGAEYGVFRAKPSESLIGELCANLIAR
jgi:exodeoxyribonuclease V beta subunit